MKIEATESGRLILRNSDGVIQHITPPNVYMHLHQRDDNAVLISTSANNQDEDNSIVILLSEVTGQDDQPFQGTRADLMEGFAYIFGYAPDGADGGGGDDAPADG